MTRRDFKDRDNADKPAEPLKFSLADTLKPEFWQRVAEMTKPRKQADDDTNDKDETP